MKRIFKPIPNFESEDEERKFWSSHDTCDYLDWDNALVNPDMNKFVRDHSSPLYVLRHALLHFLFKGQAKLSSLINIW